MKKKTLLILLILALVGLLIVLINAIIDLRETFIVAEQFGVFSKERGSYFIDGQQVSAGRFMTQQWFYIISDVLEIAIIFFVEIVLLRIVTIVKSQRNKDESTRGDLKDR